MRCSKCGAENPNSKRFCGDCGATLANRCPKCGSDNPPGKKFCGECGVALSVDKPEGPPTIPSTSGFGITPEQPGAFIAAAGERKTVTALFADIKGSMDLMEDLDPEEARAIVDPALKLMIDAVNRYGGHVVQSTGDGVFALFGAPLAYEDHPQRALYSAVRIQDEMQRYSAKLREAGHPPLEARVGVNTGEVVIRSVATAEGHSEYTPIGHSISLAARMQVLAPSGSIAATQQVKNLCEGYFLFKLLGPTAVKGVTAPVDVYEVTGLGPLRTHFQISARRGLTRFVGREPEMAALDRAAELVKSGHGQIVAVVGEPGVGKSRLFFEFNARHSAGWKQLEAFSVSHGKAAAFMPLNGLLKKYFGIDESDETRIGREKIAGRIAMLDRTLEDTLPYLFGLLGLNQDDNQLAGMDANIRRRRTLDAVNRILVRESKTQPLIVVFEDLHWIDDETQALLNLLAESIGDSAILLALNYRPEYRHDWGTRASFTQIRLEPLKRESADEMLGAMLGDDPSVVPLRKLIIEKSDATPFFIEEMVQTLFEEGMLTRNGAVRATKPVTDIHLPATVNAVLASRIDRLSPQEKELLQTLAVIGDEFALRLVREVVKIPSEDLDSMLSRLQDGEFIYEQAAADDIEYRFKHALTREVAYNSLLIERRKVVHERTGLALESMFAGQLEDHLDELAHHYSRSDKVAKAAHYLCLGGKRALDSSAHTEAKALLSSALERLRTLPESSDRDRTELTTQIAVGELTIALKGYGDPEVERAYGRAAELCRRLPDIPHLLRARALSGLVGHHQLRSHYRTCLEMGKELLALSRDINSLPTAYLCFATPSFWMGDLEVAREYLEKILAVSRNARTAVHIRVGIPSVTSSYLAWTLWYMGYPDQGLAAARHALATAKKQNHAFSFAQALSFVARFHVLRREPTIALELANEGLEYSERNNFPTWTGESTLVRGWALAQLGREEEGIAAMRAGLVIRDAIKEYQAQSHYQAWLAEALGRVGRVQEGLDLIASYLDKEHEVAVYESEVHLVRASLYLEQDPPNILQAKHSTQAAIEIAQGFAAKSSELRATTSFARLLASQGKRKEARAILAEIYNWFTEGFDTTDLKDAKALLDELSR